MQDRRGSRGLFFHARIYWCWLDYILALFRHMGQTTVLLFSMFLPRASPNYYYSGRLAKSFQHIYMGTISIGDMEQSYFLARQEVVAMLNCDISNQKAVPTLVAYRFISFPERKNLFE